MDKQQLISIVKEWVHLDGEIAALKRQTAGLNNQKKELTKQLVAAMKERHLDEIDLSDGKLVHQTRKTKAPLNKKTLEGCLGKYFKNEEKGKEMSEYILGARLEKVSDAIVNKKSGN